LKNESYAIWKWEQVGELLLICASGGRYDPVDYEPCLELHRTNQVVRALIWALGDPQMTPVERKRASAAMGDHKQVVITDSRLARGIITAMSWLGNRISAYPSNRLVDAVRDVGLVAGYDDSGIIEKMTALKDTVVKELSSRSGTQPRRRAV
jgi:hypothetical protein